MRRKALRKNRQPSSNVRSRGDRATTFESLECRAMLTSTVDPPPEADPITPESAEVNYYLTTEKLLERHLAQLEDNPELTRALPLEVSKSHEWENIVVEVWLSATGEHLVSDFSFDMQYDTKFMSAVEVKFATEFSDNQSFVIDDETGLITNIHATLGESITELEANTLFAEIHFDLEFETEEPQLGDNVLLNHQTGFVGYHLSEFSTENESIALREEHPVDLSIVEIEDLELVPVIYDLNDDHQVGLHDLTELVSNFGKQANSIAAGDSWFSDLDKDYQVGMSDLILLLQHFGQNHEKHNISLPSNLPEDWVPNPAIGDGGNNNDPDDPVEEPEPKPVLELQELQNVGAGIPDFVLPGAAEVFVMMVDREIFPVQVDWTQLSGAAAYYESGESQESQIVLTIHLEEEEVFETEIEIVFEGELIDTITEWFAFEGIISEYVSELIVSVRGLFLETSEAS